MKQISLLLILMLWAAAGIAQSQFGFKAAYLIPNYKITSTPPNSTETLNEDNNLAFTLNYKRRWPGLFNFGGEIEYYQVNSHFNSTYTSLGAHVERDVDFTVNYLNFRILPEFVFGKKFRPYIQIGPYLGFLLKSTAKGYRILSDENGSVKLDEDMDASDDFANVDWGIFMGAGAEYPIGKSFKIAVELQYTRGFAQFAQEDKYVFATRNFTMGLSFIYVLRAYADRVKE